MADIRWRAVCSIVSIDMSFFERYASRLVWCGVLTLGACPGYDDRGGDTSRESPEEMCDLDTGPYWSICADLAGTTHAMQSGEVGAARIDLTLGPRLVRDLVSIVLIVEVRTGQAAPGSQLLLTLDDQAWQSPLLGAFDNHASFRVELEPDACHAACTLSFLVSGDPIDTDVPVPLELTGQVVVLVNGANGRDKYEHYEQPFVEVVDAP